MNNTETQPISEQMGYTKDYDSKLESVLVDVGIEVERAKRLFPKMFVNQHEAYGVIAEEFRELEIEIFKNQKNYDLKEQRKEATQLAAMAIRLIIELL